MVQINFAAREINCKIVYYGPGRSGKTTNLEQVHLLSPKKCVGEMVSIATETDRTLFFDFLPLDIGKVAGMLVKFQLYTVPGQVYYNATRKLVLQGVDGVVFVADSQRSMMEENIESLNNLYENLRENGYDPNTLPIVLQYNKQDLADLSTNQEMDSSLNPNGLATSGAVAINGKGVFDSLKKIAVLVLDKLNKEYGGKHDDTSASQTGGAPPPKPAAPPSPPPAPEPPAASKADTPPAAPPAPAVAPPPKPVTASQPRPVTASQPRPVTASQPKPSAPAPPPTRPAQQRAASSGAAQKMQPQQQQGGAQKQKSSNKWVWLVMIGAVAVIIALVIVVLKYAL